MEVLRYGIIVDTGSQVDWFGRFLDFDEDASDFDYIYFLNESVTLSQARSECESWLSVKHFNVSASVTIVSSVGHPLRLGARCFLAARTSIRGTHYDVSGIPSWAKTMLITDDINEQCLSFGLLQSIAYYCSRWLCFARERDLRKCQVAVKYFSGEKIRGDELVAWCREQWRSGNIQHCLLPLDGWPLKTSIDIFFCSIDRETKWDLVHNVVKNSVFLENTGIPITLSYVSSIAFDDKAGARAPYTDG